MEYDPKQWMREALANRQIISDLQAANCTLQKELDKKNFKLDLMDACVSQIGMSEKLHSAMEAKMHPISNHSTPQCPSPRKSPRRLDKRNDQLIFGGDTNKFAHGSEELHNIIQAHSPRRTHEITHPHEPPRIPISPRKIKHDAQLFGSASDENKFAFGSPRYNEYITTHHPTRTNEITEYPRHNQAFVCGSDMYQKTAAYESSYLGQSARTEHARCWTFEREEAALRQTKDIFGNEKKSINSQRYQQGQDCIDHLLQQSTEKRSPRKYPPYNT